MKAEITKELVFNNFANKTTPLQRKQIDDWLQSTTHEELYYKWLEEWENTNPEYQPQSETLIKQYTDFLYSNPQSAWVEDAEEPTTYFRLKQWWGRGTIAASVVFLLGTGLWLFSDSIYFKNYQTAYGEVKSFVLADGSQVTLNANSSLRVPRWGFGEANREVLLDGEANFAVTHTINHQKFVVKTDKNFEVVVLGTEFSVFSRQRGAKVVLNKGKVLVNYQEGNTSKKIMMKPGELVSFDKQNQASLKILTQPQNFSLWQEKRFVFEETMLSDVAQMLEETYGLKVTIDTPELANRKLMGSFRADNVDELLHTISELLDINVVRQEDQVQLSQK